MVAVVSALLAVADHETSCLMVASWSAVEAGDFAVVPLCYAAVAAHSASSVVGAPVHLAAAAS